MFHFPDMLLLSFLLSLRKLLLAGKHPVKLFYHNSKGENVTINYDVTLESLFASLANSCTDCWPGPITTTKLFGFPKVAMDNRLA